jgi:hypothetical protein
VTQQIALFVFMEINMNNYKQSSLPQKVPIKVIQLALGGLDNSSNQDNSQCLELPGTCISPRVLKVVEIGDFWAKRTMPSIRLQGKWMLRAGVLPNRHVQITNPSPGVLLIQVLEADQQTTRSDLQTHNLQTTTNQSTKRS